MFNRKKITVPPWASVLSRKKYSLFIAAVEDYFNSRGDLYTISDGFVHYSENDQRFGLSNLAQMCARIKPAEYPELISRHFGLVIENMVFRETIDY